MPNCKTPFSIPSVTDEEEEEMLKKPKYLQCPASFTVNMLRKFIINKFGIDITQFSVSATVFFLAHTEMLIWSIIYLTMGTFTGGHNVQS